MAGAGPIRQTSVAPNNHTGSEDAMLFVKTFKGYEDKTLHMDAMVNDWITKHGVKVVDVKTALSHESGGRASSGDLLYTILYEAEAPVQE
jgi:hypothetical protein